MPRQDTSKPEAPLVTCPTCGRKIRWSADNPWRPFCSERCRIIDLGEWLTESHRIPGDTLPPEEGEEPQDR